MIVKCILGKFINGDFRAVIYKEGIHRRSRIVIDFTKNTLLEVLYYLEVTFGIEKETVEVV